LAAQIDYNNRMLGFKGEELAMQNAYQMGMLGVNERSQAAQERFQTDSTAIARMNAETDRIYKEGALGVQREQVEAQKDAARSQLIVGGITGLGSFAGTALGVWDKSRQFAADMRTRGFDAQGNKLVSPRLLLMKLYFFINVLFLLMNLVVVMPINLGNRLLITIQRWVIRTRCLLMIRVDIQEWGP
jgi:hypothetical protein